MIAIYNNAAVLRAVLPFEHCVWIWSALDLKLDGGWWRVRLEGAGAGASEDGQSCKPARVRVFQTARSSGHQWPRNQELPSKQSAGGATIIGLRPLPESSTSQHQPVRISIKSRACAIEIHQSTRRIAIRASRAIERALYGNPPRRFPHAISRLRPCRPWSPLSSQTAAQARAPPAPTRNLHDGRHPQENSCEGRRGRCEIRLRCVLCRHYVDCKRSFCSNCRLAGAYALEIFPAIPHGGACDREDAALHHPSHRT